MKTKIKLIGLLLFAAFLFTACSSDGSSSSRSNHGSHSGHNH